MVTVEDIKTFCVTPGMFDGVSVELNGRLLSADEVDNMLRDYFNIKYNYRMYESKLEKYENFFKTFKELLNLQELEELSDEVKQLQEDLKETNYSLANHQGSNNVHKRWL